MLSAESVSERNCREETSSRSLTESVLQQGEARPSSSSSSTIGCTSLVGGGTATTGGGTTTDSVASTAWTAAVLSISLKPKPLSHWGFTPMNTKRGSRSRGNIYLYINIIYITINIIGTAFIEYTEALKGIYHSIKLLLLLKTQNPPK